MLKLLKHSYGQFTSRQTVGPVVWPHFDLLYIHTGRIRLRLAAGHEIVLARDEGALIYPDTPFSITTLTPTARNSVQHFSFEAPKRCPNLVLGELAELKCGCDVYKRPHSAEVRTEIMRAMALATLQPHPRTQVIREAQITLILGLLRNSLQSHEETSNGAESFHQILAWASRRFGAVSVAALARRSSYSVDRFREIFLEKMGITPSDYLIKIRMSEASRRLRESRAPMKEIARDLGYGDVVAFHRAFIRENPCPPGAYRRRFAPGREVQ